MQKYNCDFIGEGSLLIQCCQIWLKNGHIIRNIISPDLQILQWAIKKQISAFSSLTEAKKTKNRKAPDFLFSINNKTILNSTIINQAKQLSINYHNSPLPRYAGANATAWAILNDEKKHGVTWHIMSEKIDQGDIIIQKRFPIAQNENTYTLEKKCEKYALETFRKLLINIENNTLKTIKQDHRNRSYYSLTQKPNANGLISWKDTAEKIQRKINALSFGSTTNSMSVPHFFLNEKKFFIIESSNITNITPKHPAGTVTNIDKNQILVCTLNFSIKLTIRPLNISRNLKNLKDNELKKIIPINTILESPTKTQAKSYEKYAETLAKHEKFWIKELEEYQAISWFKEKNIQKKKPSKFKCLKISISKKFNNLLNEYSFNEIATTLLAVYFYKLNNYEKYSMNISSLDIKNNKKIPSSLINKFLPLNINIDEKNGIEKVGCTIKKKIGEIKKHKNFTVDIFERNKDTIREPLNSLINVSFNDNKKNHNCSVIISINRKLKKIIVSYDQKLIAKEQHGIIKNIPHHIKEIVDNIIKNKETPIRDINILPRKAKNKIFLIKKEVLPPKKLLHQLFEKQAKITPRKMALESKNEKMTYAALNQQANQLARYIKRLTPKKSIVIAILLEKNIKTIIWILAILKAGKTYLVIDLNYPQARIQYIIDDCNPQLIISSSKHLNLLSKKQQTRTININLLKKENLNFQKNNLNIEINPNSIAYLIYTSGSTGKPKGVLVKHMGLPNLIQNQIRKIGLKKTSKVLQFASLGFDASIHEIFPTICAGATLVIPSRSESLPGPSVIKCMNNYRISIATLPPAVLEVLPVKKIKTLKVIVLAGESPSSHLIKKWQKLYCIMNAYGPTEYSVCTSINRSLSYKHSSNIGKPIKRTEVYITDKYLNLLPEHVPGEICISGIGVAQGYLNQTELTKEKFFKKNLNSKNHFNVYRSGDLAKWTENFEINYIGRIDKQVKIQATRVEPSEIEEQISNFKNIKSCVIILVKNDNRNIIIAFISTEEPNKKNIINKLKIYLKSNLPDFMQPQDFIMLKNLPLSTSGKIDYDTLKKIYQSHLNNLSLVRNNNLEDPIMRIWKKTLQINNIGYDDILDRDLGANSLDIAIIWSKILEIHPEAEAYYEKFIQSPSINNFVKLLQKKHIPKKIKKETKNFHKITFNSMYNDKPIKSIFLTGSTGFIGSHILNNLAKNKQVEKIFCLVREKNEILAKQKILNVLKKYRIYKKYFEKKIIPILGDLEKEKIGLSNYYFNYLTNNIDAIYHTAAKINHIFSYEALKKCNVDSTKTLIKISSTNRIKPIYYLSSLSMNNNFGRLTENFTQLEDEITVFHNGYSKTKWKSEQLLLQAKQHGIPVIIYRLPWVIGNEQTPLNTLKNNHLALLIDICIQTGVAPKWRGIIPYVSVADISSFITTTSLSSHLNSNIFNISGKNLFSWQKLIKTINQIGYSIKLVSPKEWKEIISAHNNVKNIKQIIALYNSTSLLENSPFIQNETIANNNYIESIKLLNTNNLNKLKPGELNFLKAVLTLAKIPETA